MFEKRAIFLLKTKGTVDSIEKLCDEEEIVNEFCYLGDRLNSSDGCETAGTARVRFRECEELLLGKRFLLRMKENLSLLRKDSNIL